MFKKNIIIIIFVFGLLQLRAEAISRYSEDLSKIEKSIFNTSFEQQNDEDRLSKIEKNIYGVNFNAPTSVRVDKLTKDLLTEVIGLETEPKKDSFLEDDEIITEKPIEEMDFSIVNNLEKKIFQYEFKTLDVCNRLAALENHVLKKCYLNDDISTRIKRLQGVVFYNRQIEENKIASIPNLRQKKVLLVSPKKIINTNNKQPKEEKMSVDSNIKLVSLETALFSKTYPKENNSQRLARLETKIFQVDFSDDDSETRLNRVSKAEEAQKSIKKYKGNKASNRVATTIELGTILMILLPLLLL